MENYRPTMSGDVLHSWAKDAQAELVELSEIREDFCQCDKEARHLATMFPDTPGIWTGTVSERLAIGIQALMAYCNAHSWPNATFQHFR